MLARLEPAQTRRHIAGPAELAVLAVARNIDADLGLLAHHLGDARPQRFLERGLVDRAPQFLGG